MPYIPLKIPPGVARLGTDYVAKGRWTDTNLVRWYEGVLQAVGAWLPMRDPNAAHAVINVGGQIHGVVGWRSNIGGAYIAVGARASATLLKNISSIYAVKEVITPSGFVAMDVTGRWALDAFGEDIVAVGSTASLGGTIYYYDLSVGGLMVALANAPTAWSVVVTPERFVFALGAAGDSRAISWSDQESPTTWAPAVTNQAGDFQLVGAGRLMSGRRARNETLLWTDTDLWTARYIGGDFVYGFHQLGTNCGLMAPDAVALVDGKAMWMGQRGFFTYDGFVKPVPCEVADLLWGTENNSMLLSETRHITAYTRARFGEIMWHYASISGVNAGLDDSHRRADRYVSYNYINGTWAIGDLSRTGGLDIVVTRYEVATGSDGQIYMHEIPVSTSFVDSAGTHTPNRGGVVPFAESGPIELGDGDNVTVVRQIVPDGKTVGGVTMTLKTRFHPTASETSHGPFSMANPTSVRLTGRQVRVRVQQNAEDWRFGVPRLEVVLGGLR